MGHIDYWLEATGNPTIFQKFIILHDWSKAGTSYLRFRLIALCVCVCGLHEHQLTKAKESAQGIVVKYLV